MRWRFVDRIDGFEPWASMRGRKSVSLEEYGLLEWSGRKGIFPESLILESCVHLVRWFVVKSSDFQKTCLLTDIEHFAYKGEVGPGDTLTMEVISRTKEEETLEVECQVVVGARRVSKGLLRFSLPLLQEFSDPQTLKSMWQELYGAA